MSFESLTPSQRDAINEIDHNLQIIACAGSGKTEVITRRIANILMSRPEIKPENIVAFTFTNKAAEMMKERIAGALSDTETNIDNMYIGTIHSFCSYILTEYSEEFKNTKVLDEITSHLFVQRYYNSCGLEELGLARHIHDVRTFFQCIDKMIDDHDNYDQWTETQKNAFDRYSSCLREHGFIDFSFLIYEAIRQIKINKEVQDYISSIKYLVVDEYQDINDIQETLIHLFSDHGANICVVGDDDQTIYQFRGSNADNMISFSKNYPDVRQIRLEKNFRCSKEIIDIADRVIQNNTHRLLKKMESGTENGVSTIKATRYESKDQQFDSIAERIKDLHDSGIPYNEIAILVRKNKAITAASRALEVASIPYESNSSEYFFLGKYYDLFVRTMIAIKEPDRKVITDIWRDTITDYPKIANGFKYIRKVSFGRLSEIISEFCDKIGFLDESYNDVEIRKQDLESFKEILNDYDEIYGDYQLVARIDNLKKYLDKQASEEYKYKDFRQKTEEAVQILTVHKSKGLEFHTVFLPELSEREFPMLNSYGRQYWHVLGGRFEENKDKYKASLDDERKLFYVAVTRAKTNLFMSYVLESQSVSCFVKEAAESPYLEINRDDLKPVQRVSKGRSTSKTSAIQEIADEIDEEEPIADDIAEYWETVRYARRQLMDYFGSATHFNPAAYGDLMRVKEMSPDEILEVACANGII